MRKALVILVLTLVIAVSSVGIAENVSGCECLCCQGIHNQQADAEVTLVEKTPEEAYEEWLDFAWPLLYGMYADGTWCTSLYYYDDVAKYANPSFLLHQNMKTITTKEVEELYSYAEDDFKENMNEVTHMHQFIHEGNTSLVLVTAMRSSNVHSVPVGYECIDNLMCALIDELSKWRNGLVSDIESGMTLNNSNNVRTPDKVKALTKKIEALMSF